MRKTTIKTILNAYRIIYAISPKGRSAQYYIEGAKSLL